MIRRNPPPAQLPVQRSDRTRTPGKEAAQAVRKVAKATGIDPKKLVIEVKEIIDNNILDHPVKSSLIDDTKSAQMEILCKLGVPLTRLSVILGLNDATMRAHLKNHPEFRDKLQNHRITRFMWLIQKMYAQIEKGQWSAIEWGMKKLFPDWTVVDQSDDISGSDTKTLTITVEKIEDGTVRLIKRVGEQRAMELTDTSGTEEAEITEAKLEDLEDPDTIKKIQGAGTPDKNPDDPDFNVG